MSKPISGLVYYIISQEFGLAWDLFQGNMDFVVGARPNKQSSQKWRFLEIDGFWVIENISNLQFANVEHADPILPGVKVITANPRNWELIPDPEFDGWRFVAKNTNLNAEIALVVPPLPEVPVILGERLPGKNQVWRLEEAER